MPKGGRTLLWHGVTLLTSFCMARAELWQYFSPLGLAFATGVPVEYTLSAALGAMLGYWIPAVGQNNIRYMGATAIACFLIWILGAYIKPAIKPTVSALLSGGCLLGVLLVFFFAGEVPITIATLIGECCLASGTAFFFSTFFTAVQKGRSNLSAYETTASFISVTLLISSLIRIQFNDISPARIAAMLLVLYAAYYGKETLGAICGIAAGFAAYLADADLKTAALALCLAGLIGGVFSPLKKMGVSLGFLLAVGLILIPNYHVVFLPLIYESTVAVIIFMVLPVQVGRLFNRLFTPDCPPSYADGMRNNVVLRLSFAAGAVRDVSQTVEDVSARLKRLNAPTFERVFTRTEQDACQSCSMRIYCWESNRGETLSALLAAVKQLRKSGVVGVEDLPDSFAKQCLHPPRVLDGLARHFADFLSKDSAERRLEEIRQVIAEQFEGVADMLEGLSEEIGSTQRFDFDTCQILRAAFLSLDIEPLDISCQVDRYNHVTAEVRLDAQDQPRVNRSVLMRTLKEKSGRQFEVPTITEGGNTLLLTLSEQAEYTVDFGVAQLPFNDNKLCGDAYHTFYDGRGRFVVIVSDGMGKGGRAAVDGVMASGLMARLLKAGFSPDSALKIVNSAMLYKSTDESLATIDVTVLDLFGGRAEFYKAGAPATLIRKSGKAGLAQGENLPAGILQGVAFDTTATTLSKGDVVVMVSDGALGDGTDWIGVELEVWKRGSAQALAEHLADYARRRCPDGHGDDITVAVAILEKGYS